MGFFLKALAAIATADAIDRHARRPPKYWYPNQPGQPPASSHTPYARVQHRPAPEATRGGWNPAHPERP